MRDVLAERRGEVRSSGLRPARSSGGRLFSPGWLATYFSMAASW